MLSIFLVVAFGAMQFGFDDLDADAGAVDCLEERGEGNPTTEQVSLTPTLVSIVVVAPPTSVSPPTPVLSTPVPTRSAPAAAPLIKTDTVPPLDVKIENNARVIQGK